MTDPKETRRSVADALTALALFGAAAFAWAEVFAFLASEGW